MVVSSSIYGRALPPHATLEIWRTDSLYSNLLCDLRQVMEPFKAFISAITLWFNSLYPLVLLDHVIVVSLADSIVLIRQVT